MFVDSQPIKFLAPSGRHGLMMPSWTELGWFLEICFYIHVGPTGLAVFACHVPLGALAS
jgi:hypothetical protein